MAERQSRTINAAYTLWVDQAFNFQLFTLGLVFLLSICLVQFAHAEDNLSIKVAMGDVGAIKSDPSDKAAQVKWVELTKEQQQILAPLGKEWDTLRPWQREKMLDIAKQYPKMDVQKQTRIQKRLVAWSRMTPYERENARKRYQQFHSLSPEKKDELRKKWLEHQKLPEAEREKLRQDSELYYDPDLD